MQRTEGQRLALLLVEDDKDISELMVELYETWMPNICIISAKSVEEAESLYSSWVGNDLIAILVDGRLNGQSGIEFVSWLKKRGDYHGNVVAFSADPREVEEMSKAGCNEAIEKPFDPEFLAKRIAHWLANKEGVEKN